MGRNKQVACKKWYRVMRSDNLKTHINMHEKYETIIKKDGSLHTSASSIGSSRTSLSETESEFSSSTPAHTPSPIDDEAVIKKVVMDATEYQEKMELGKRIYEHVKEYNIPEESICKVYKEALEFYMKQKKNSDLQNVILSRVY
jgi:hypothetical protein